MNGTVRTSRVQQVNFFLQFASSSELAVTGKCFLADNLETVTLARAITHRLVNVTEAIGTTSFFLFFFPEEIYLPFQDEFTFYTLENSS